MAHNLLVQAGGVSMFYVGDPPWHRLGQQLAKPATADQAIKAAKLDWEVLKVPLYAVAESRLQQLRGKFALVPADRWGQAHCPIFGIVGESYAPLQNRDAFRFFDPIIGSDAAIYHTAGALGEGEQVWMLAQISRPFEVAPDDKVEPYVLLSNGHDGRSSVRLKFTPIRVVCQNTLNAALRTGPTIRIPHHSDLTDRLEAARLELGLYSYRIDLPDSKREAEQQTENLYALLNRGIDQYSERFRKMAAMRLKDAEAQKYFENVFPAPQTKDPDRARRAEEGRKMAAHFYRNGQGNTGAAVSGTLWAAYNGVTEYVDHRGGRTAERPVSDDRHLQSMWFGSGAVTKARALEQASVLVDA